MFAATFSLNAAKTVYSLKSFVIYFDCNNTLGSYFNNQKKLKKNRLIAKKNLINRICFYFVGDKA